MKSTQQLADELARNCAESIAMTENAIARKLNIATVYKRLIGEEIPLPELLEVARLLKEGQTMPMMTDKTYDKVHNYHQRVHIALTNLQNKVGL